MKVETIFIELRGNEDNKEKRMEMTLAWKGRQSSVLLG